MGASSVPHLHASEKSSRAWSLSVRAWMWSITSSSHSWRDSVMLAFLQVSTQEVWVSSWLHLCCRALHRRLCSTVTSS